MAPPVTTSVMGGAATEGLDRSDVDLGPRIPMRRICDGGRGGEHVRNILASTGRLLLDEHLHLAEVAGAYRSAQPIEIVNRRHGSIRRRLSAVETALASLYGRRMYPRAPSEHTGAHRADPVKRLSEVVIDPRSSAPSVLHKSAGQVGASSRWQTARRSMPRTAGSARRRSHRHRVIGRRERRTTAAGRELCHPIGHRAAL